jgi:hypothetical protein
VALLCGLPNGERGSGCVFPVVLVVPVDRTSCFLSL